MNGVDTLSYLRISDSTVIPFTALSNPSAPTLTTLTGLTGSTFNVYYRVTANSTVGETAASSALTQAVLTDRDLWAPATQSVKIGWSAVASARDYNVYMGTVSGFEFLIASGINGLEFTDNGTMAQDTTRLYPTSNSTAGPKVSRGTNIGGRAFLVGDKDNPYYVWNGGDSGNELDFTPVNGGGFNLIGDGSKEPPIAVRSFRDGKGTSQITVLCQGTSGNGKRFIMTPDSVTLGSSVISFYSITEDSDQEGTDSPDGIIRYGTDLHYPSRDGFKTTGTQPQIQNVLSTRRTSNTIQPDMKLLNSSNMGGAVGVGFEGRLYWALPVSSTTNSEIWVLDLDRKGAWMKPWSIAADWLWLYNDNVGKSHFMVLSNNVMYSMGYSRLTTDGEVAFRTGAQSGQIFFSDDKRMWVQLLMVIFVLLSPKGTITFQVNGKTEDNAKQALGDPYVFTADDTTTVVGWGEVNAKILGWGRNRWSKINLIPKIVGVNTQEVSIEVDEEVQWADYSWASTLGGVDYNLSDVIYIYIETGIKDLQ